MTVRRATPDDARAIADVLRDAFAPYARHYTPEGFAATVPDEEVIRARFEEGPVWVVLRDDAIVGTVAAVLKDTGAYVRSMALVPKARGHGGGAQLLGEAERFARQHRTARLFLSTTPFLAEAIRLYERHGFRRTAEGPLTLGGTPLVTMEKLLSGAIVCCPRCGSPGKAVDRRTVEALLTEPASVRVSAVEYRFCPDAECQVVYFGADAVCFTTVDVRVAVWQKEPVGDRRICYCFDESEAAIRAEIAAHGQSFAVERIREHIAARRCACEVRNPLGTCCLGDVIAAIARAGGPAGAVCTLPPAESPAGCRRRLVDAES